MTVLRLGQFKKDIIMPQSFPLAPNHAFFGEAEIHEVVRKSGY